MFDTPDCTLIGYVKSFMSYVVCLFISLCKMVIFNFTKRLYFKL